MKRFCIALCLGLMLLCLPVSAFAADPVQEGNPAADAVTFGVVSDVHITGSATREKQRFKTALEYYADQGAASTFVAGDLTNNGSVVQLAAYKGVVDNADIGTMTVHESMGNHDRQAGTSTYFTAATGDAVNSHFVINGYHFITVSPDNSTVNGSGIYTNSIAWLTEQLELAEQDTGNRPIFVFAHHAVHNTVYVSPEWYGDLPFELFNQYPQVVFFSGHSHAPNQNPTSIYQGKFTAVNTVTLSYIGAESGYGNSDTDIPGGSNVAQGLLVQVDGTQVTITTRDFVNGENLPNTWVFDTADLDPDDPTTYPYHTERRKANSYAPVFAPDAEITLDGAYTNGVEFTFPQAQIPEEDLTNDVVHSYRFTISREDGTVVSTHKIWSEYYFTPMPDTLSQFMGGLSRNTRYTLSVYPVNAYGVEGEPLTLSFSTENDHLMADILNVDLSCGTADRAGHSLTTFGEPTLYTDETLDRQVAQFDGENDGLCYRLNLSDYEAFRFGFSMELYYKVGTYESGEGEQDIFSGAEGAGIAITQTEDGLQFWGHFNGKYTKVRITAPEGEWNHVVIAYDGTAICTYLNGELQTTTAQTGILSIPPEKARCLVLGGDISSSGRLETPGACTISVARLYSCSLTASDVAERYDIVCSDARTLLIRGTLGHLCLQYCSTPTKSSSGETVESWSVAGEVTLWQGGQSKSELFSTTISPQHSLTIDRLEESSEPELIVGWVRYTPI